MSRRGAIKTETAEPAAPAGRSRRTARPRAAETTLRETPVREPIDLSEQRAPRAGADNASAATSDTPTGPDRDRLHAEMIEMRVRYLDGAAEAATNQEKFRELSARVKTLLDEEFPGWEEETGEHRTDMVTLYFQYRADEERATAIQAKFERLTLDIEMLLAEEFPDWKQ